LRLNFSKSISAGARGAHITAGRKGVRETIGLPGSGLSYTEYTKYPQTSEGLYDHPQEPAGRHRFRNFLLWLAVLAIGFAIVTAMMAPAHAASTKDCETFVYLAIATTHATEECDIDFMDDPGVVRVVDKMIADKCVARIGKAGINVQADRAWAMWDRMVKASGKKAACARMSASMSILNR
jgi:Protein of unknown function (DUF4236)